MLSVLLYVLSMKEFLRHLIAFVAGSLLIFSSCTPENVERYTLSTGASPVVGGTVTPSQGTFDSGDEVTLAATPTKGYTFKNWLGAISGTSNPTKFEMNSDKEITAVFEKTDTDLDGISDDLDQCPGTPEGSAVDSNGCSTSQVDTDGDGVTDDKDQCADTLEGETVDENGCSTSQVDSDGDGVTDDIDQCADTLEGETVDENGCSTSQVDSDGDGVTDDKDQCAQTLEGETVDENGCTPGDNDGDGDGVENTKDECPNTPSGETVDANGCSTSQKDSDGDGVDDDIDTCPGTPSGDIVDANGCSQGQKDSDGDGVSEDRDSCPDTPTGESVDGNGCSESQMDSDLDGVNDNIDQCPDTPSGLAVDGNGCSEGQRDTDGDGVGDDLDTCPDTPAGATVNSDGCSDSQSDKTPPAVSDVIVTDITMTSFKVDWSLDEGSKGYIRFGTSQGVYVGSTNIEDGYLTRHVQTVGGTNPAPLLPGTTYYYQIYVEDRYGNTGFSEELSATTSEEEARTYVPDDAFEQYLIDQGFDDVLDDYVVTVNISSITELRIIDLDNIDSLIGIEDFEGLLTLEIRDTFTPSLDVGKMINLENLIINYNTYYLDEYPDGTPRPISRFTEIDLSNNQNLSFLYLTNTLLENLDLSSNQNLEVLALYSNYGLSYGSMFNLPNLKDLGFGSDASGPGVAFPVSNINFSNLTALESLQLIGLENESGVIDLSNNSKLGAIYCLGGFYELNIGNNLSLKTFNAIATFTNLDLSLCPNLNRLSITTAAVGGGSVSGLNLKNGNNRNMSVELDFESTDGCIQVDDANYSGENWLLSYKSQPSIYSEDCGF